MMGAIEYYVKQVMVDSSGQVFTSTLVPALYRLGLSKQQFSKEELTRITPRRGMPHPLRFQTATQQSQGRKFIAGYQSRDSIKLALSTSPRW